MLYAGADNAFGTADDTKIALKPGYSFPETNLTLQLPNGVLAEGNYRLRLSGTLGIFDTAGNLLDGNADGAAGGDYLRLFTIDRSGNQPPTATDAVVSTNEAVSLLITLAGTDPNGDALSFSLLSNPAHGTLTDFDPVARTVRYTPAAGFNGTDSFRFRVDDGNLGSDDGNLLINVLPVNARPAGAATAAATDEDTAVQILLPGSDAETARANLAFNPVAQPAHGSLILGPGGLWTYLPDADFNGTDSFTYTVTDRGDPDGAGGNALSSLPATVTVTVRPVNDAPRIGAIVLPAVDEGQLLSFTVPGSDPDGTALTYTLVGAAIPGATLNPGTGLLRFNATDGAATVPFTVRVSDGVFNTEASFNVVVNNLAPAITLTGAASVDVGTPYTVQFSASDPGQDTIAGWLVRWGDGTSLALPGTATSATRSFSTGGNFSITVTATDEDGSTTSTPLTVRAIAPNRPPVVPATQNGAVDEDQTVLLTLSYGDPDGDPVTVSFPALPQHGVLGSFDPVSKQLRYTPAANFNGSDSFQIRVDDGLGGVSTGLVNLTVRPVNDAPAAQAAAFTVVSGSSHVGQLAGTDLETAPAALLFAAVGGPQHGSLTVNPDGSFSYTPTVGFVGVDAFSFQVTDRGDPTGAGVGLGAPLASSPQTVTIAVLSGNRAPVAVADQYSVRANRTLAIAAPGLLANDSDADGDALSISSIDVTGTQGTVAAFADGHFSFTPTAGFTGQTSFKYNLADGVGGTAQAVVTVNVVNTAPVLAADSYSVHAGQVLQIPAPGLLGNDSDADGDALAVSAIDVTGTQGTVAAFADGHFSFTPTVGFTGATSFKYNVADGFGGTAQATVAINVTNAAPVAVADQFNMRPGQVLQIAAPGLLGNDSDADGDALSISSIDVTGTQGTVAAFADGHFSFTPTAGFTGQTSFKYNLADGVGGTAQAVVTVNVVNTAPVLAADSYSVHAGQVLQIPAPGLLGNDSDADGDALAVSAIDVTGTQGTVAAFADGHFSFTPTVGFTGQTSFKYNVADGFGGTAQASVTVQVTNANPVAVDDAYTVQAGQVLDVVLPGLLANDSDADGDALMITAIDVTGTQGTAAVYADGHFRFTPTAGFIGDTSFGYALSDGVGGTAQARVLVRVLAPPSLKVVSFQATDTGFAVRFDRPVDAAQVALYGAGAAAPGDLVLTGPAGPVNGSLVFDADGQGARFIKTGGLLAAGNYSLTLASGAAGFVALGGLPLDGNADGTPGDAYTRSFTVLPFTGAVLAVQEFARGPGQVANLDPAANGFFVSLAGGAGALSLVFDLQFDPQLLSVTGATLAAGAPAGSGLVTDLSVAGRLRITVTLGSALPDATLRNLVSVQATVPASASYGAAEVLALRNLAINGGAIQARADDGLHAVAYLGDATGNRALGSDDVSLIQRVVVRADSGFAAWRLVDPVRIADVTRDNTLNSVDALLVARAAAGLLVPALPPIPVVAAPLLLPAAQNAQESSAGPTVVVAGKARTAAAAAVPVVALSSKALDFGIDRQANADSGWVSEWLSGPKPAATNAWKLTI